MKTNTIIICIIVLTFTVFSSVKEELLQAMLSEESAFIPEERFKKFYDTHNTPYERRYIIQYAPDYLKNSHDIPAWFKKALKEALKSNHERLILSAIKTIGALHLNEFDQDLLDQFVNSSTVTGASTLRIEVMTAMEKCKSLPANQLLDAYPIEMLGCPSLPILLKMVLTCGEDVSLEKIGRFEKAIRATDKDPEREDLLQLITCIKGKFSMAEPN